MKGFLVDVNSLQRSSALNLQWNENAQIHKMLNCVACDGKKVLISHFTHMSDIGGAHAREHKPIKNKQHERRKILD